MGGRVAPNRFHAHRQLAETGADSRVRARGRPQRDSHSASVPKLLRPSTLITLEDIARVFTRAITPVRGCATSYRARGFASISIMASYASSVVRWLYTRSIIRSELCPATLATSNGLIPDRSALVMKLWR